MSVWNPIAYTADEIERVFGPPSERDATRMVYGYDFGRGSASWVFHLLGDSVYGVEFIPGE